MCLYSHIFRPVGFFLINFRKANLGHVLVVCIFWHVMMGFCECLNGFATSVNLWGFLDFRCIYIYIVEGGEKD